MDKSCILDIYDYEETDDFIVCFNLILNKIVKRKCYNFN